MHRAPMQRLQGGGAAIERARRDQRRPGLGGHRHAFAHQKHQGRPFFNFLHHLGCRADVVHGHDAHANLDERIGVRLVVLRNTAGGLHGLDGEGARCANGEREAQLSAILHWNDDPQRKHSLHIHLHIQGPQLHGQREPFAHAERVDLTGASNDVVAWVDPVLRCGGFLVVVLHNPMSQLRDHQAGPGYHDRDAEGAVCLSLQLQLALDRRRGN
mmetsp:Transcript_151651/g.484757  ORF Transcript_151651/g.484757 Transcript_151651/m.484757 type:complete len:214 (+) Transcript_151651:143-784(+)